MACWPINVVIISSLTVITEFKRLLKQTDGTRLDEMALLTPTRQLHNRTCEIDWSQLNATTKRRCLLSSLLSHQNSPWFNIIFAKWKFIERYWPWRQISKLISPNHRPFNTQYQHRNEILCGFPKKYRTCLGSGLVGSAFVDALGGADVVLGQCAESLVDQRRGGPAGAALLHRRRRQRSPSVVVGAPLQRRWTHHDWPIGPRRHR